MLNCTASRIDSRALIWVPPAPARLRFVLRRCYKPRDEILDVAGFRRLSGQRLARGTVFDQVYIERAEPLENSLGLAPGGGADELV